MELGAKSSPTRAGGIMATVTSVCTIAYVAEMLGEDPEIIEVICDNSDNLSYGNIISVNTGDDVAITTLTDDGIEELKDMLRDARQSQRDWLNFLEYFVEDPDVIARVKENGPRS